MEHPLTDVQQRATVRGPAARSRRLRCAMSGAALAMAVAMAGCGDDGADINRVDVTAPSTLDDNTDLTDSSVIDVNPGSVSNQAPGSEVGVSNP